MNPHMEQEKVSVLGHDDFFVFLDEVLIPQYGHRLKTSTLHRCYMDWATANGSRALRIQDFVAELRSRLDVRRDCVKGNVVVGFDLESELKTQFEMPKALNRKTISARPNEISTDFVRISLDAESPVNLLNKDVGGGLRVKVGSYEFEADAGFPMEKLAELLHGLGGEVPC